MSTTSETTLIRDLLDDIRCHPRPVYICHLVEEYGAGVVPALKDLRRAGVVRLIAAGSSLAENADRAEVDLAAFKAGSIQGEGEWLILAEMAD